MAAAQSWPRASPWGCWGGAGCGGEREGWQRFRALRWSVACVGAGGWAQAQCAERACSDQRARSVRRGGCRAWRQSSNWRTRWCPPRWQAPSCGLRALHCDCGSAAACAVLGKSAQQFRRGSSTLKNRVRLAAGQAVLNVACTCTRASVAVALRVQSSQGQTGVPS